jgi:MOSC domain-containing protein YiiM
MGGERKLRMPTEIQIAVKHLYISPGHNFFGHHGKAPSEHEMREVPEVRCVAGRGIEGDRFFDFKPGYKGQVTFFAIEIYEGLSDALGIPDKAPSVFRRNIITSGADLNALIGCEFELQGVRFRGMAECSPCYWMNEAFAPGAEEWLQGRGGLRAKILTSGTLRAG